MSGSKKKGVKGPQQAPARGRDNPIITVGPEWEERRGGMLRLRVPGGWLYGHDAGYGYDTGTGTTTPTLVAAALAFVPRPAQGARRVSILKHEVERLEQLDRGDHVAVCVREHLRGPLSCLRGRLARSEDTPENRAALAAGEWVARAVEEGLQAAGVYSEPETTLRSETLRERAARAAEESGDTAGLVDIGETGADEASPSDVGPPNLEAATPANGGAAAPGLPRTATCMKCEQEVRAVPSLATPGVYVLEEHRRLAVERHGQMVAGRCPESGRRVTLQTVPDVLTPPADAGRSEP